MDLGLKDKVVLVTGGARDIGREISLTFGREGAAVAVNYSHSAEEALRIVAAIRAMGSRAEAFAADVGDYGAVSAMAAKIEAELGPVEILVNNAGQVARRFFLQTSPEDWRPQIDTGLYGVLNTCHIFAPGMVARRFGRIVNLAGDSARVGERGLAVTAASRGGVLTLTRTLAKELGESEVTVNAVALGLVETRHSDLSFIDANRARILQFYAIKRLGQPDDVAPMIAFLCSEHARWITGQTLSISGGYTTVG